MVGVIIIVLNLAKEPKVMANSIEEAKGRDIPNRMLAMVITADITILTVRSKVHIHVYMKLFLKELKKLWKYR